MRRVHDTPACDAFVNFPVQIVPEGFGHFDYLAAPYLFRRVRRSQASSRSGVPNNRNASRTTSLALL